MDDKISDSREFSGVIVDESTGNYVSKECKSLSLKNNNLSILPRFITGLKSLKILRINKNLLKDIPLDIYSLDSLKILDLSDNYISHIPPGISSMKGLITLNLSFNNLESIPDELDQLNVLKFLYLQSNKIKRMPRKILNLEDLMLLDLRDNEMVSNDSNDQVGHLSLRTVFGKNLLLTENDFDKFSNTSKLKIILRKVTKQKALSIFLIIIAIVVFSSSQSVLVNFFNILKS